MNNVTASLSNEASEFISAETSGTQNACERSSLDWPIPMNRYWDRIGDVRMPQDMMAAADPFDVPALLFKGGDDLLAADRRELGAHAAWTATRLRWTAGIGRPSSCITSR